jgi:EAL domain-containing protein (putative c-di-GMP-specific phosphodiesterase class I)
MVSVNLAVAQLRSPGLAAAVASALKHTGLSPGRLQLEITESTIVNNGDTELDTLHTLAHTGIKLAIDDFGTGYSSLAYLADLPIHAIKLAPGFLHGFDGFEGPDGVHSNNTILPALIRLGHDLDLTVTAEGIETADQAEQLANLGCDLGQGFYLGRPESPEHITDLLVNPPPQPT